MKAMKFCRRKEEFVKALQNVPQKLDAMYQRILNHVQHQQSPSAKKALLAVMYAQRSLYFEELQYVLATCPNTHQFTSQHAVDEETLESECCGLLTVEDCPGGRKRVKFFRK
jgi:hypothetical protein